MIRWMARLLRRGLATLLLLLLLISGAEVAVRVVELRIRTSLSGRAPSPLETITLPDWTVRQALRPNSSSTIGPGFIAPVTLIGTLVQHTAETLSGIVISQLTNPGTPMLYGGSPAIFDVRYETTPMGAVETQMIDCAYNEIGKYLGIPTQAYISLSDAKRLDAQAGLESGMGAALGALAGVNNMTGPGMLNFENCQSLEKLILDNEICGMTLRMVKGITPKEDFPAIQIFKELLEEKHLLIADHSRKYLREEHYFPGPVINRANRERWKQEGSSTLEDRAHDEVKKLLNSYTPYPLSEDVKKDLVNLMEKEARKFGQDTLPVRE